MDEVEARLAALELLLIEILPWIDACAVEDAERSISEGLDGATPEEQAIRRQALALIDDGRKRYDGPELQALLARLGRTRGS